MSAKVRCTVLRVSGDSETVTFESEEPPLTFLQESVGGFVELVRNLGPGTVWVNEEAVLRGLPKNEKAFEKFGDVPGTVDGYLRGDIVVVEPIQ